MALALHPLIVQFLGLIKEQKEQDVKLMEAEILLGMRQESVGGPGETDSSQSNHEFTPHVPQDVFYAILNRFNRTNDPPIEYVDEFYSKNVRIRKRVEFQATRDSRSALLAAQGSSADPGHGHVIVEAIQKFPMYALNLVGLQTKVDARMTLKLERPIARGSPMYPAESDPCTKRRKQVWTFGFPSELLQHFQVVFDIVTPSGNASPEYHVEIETRKASMLAVAQMPSRDYANLFLSAALAIAGQENVLFRLGCQIPSSEIALMDKITDSSASDKGVAADKSLAPDGDKSATGNGNGSKDVTMMVAPSSKPAAALDKAEAPIHMQDSDLVELTRLWQERKEDSARRQKFTTLVNTLKARLSPPTKSKRANVVLSSTIFYPASRNYFTYPRIK